METQMSVQITLPERDMDDLAEHLVKLTEAIDKMDSELVAHGFLGGQHGYGADFDCDAFTMRPYYWGDCDCGAEERSEAWFAANPHADDCFRSERDRRWGAYDESIGWAEIDAAMSGGLFDEMDTASQDIEIDGVQVGGFVTFTPRNDPATQKRRAASMAREDARAAIVADIYRERGLTPEPSQWLCTCGVDQRARQTDEMGHRKTCAVELPNFLHKRTGLEVRWYKYIGRSMESVGRSDKISLSAVFDECLAAVQARTP
jgi:hypothetical protein